MAKNYVTLTYEEAVKTIREAGGIPVLCHPHFYNLKVDEVNAVNELRELFRRFKEAGGLAVETEYGFYDEGQRVPLRELAKKFGLAISCGSDYHGNEHEKLNYRFPSEIGENLMKLER